MPLDVPHLILLAALLNACVGLLILVKNPRHVIHVSFFVLVIGTSMWMGGISLMYLTHDFLYDKLALGGGIVMMFGMTLFARVFPLADPIRHGFLRAFIPIPILLAILPFSLYIQSIVIDASGLVRPVPGPLLPLYVLAASGYIAYAGTLFRANFLVAKGPHRTQMLYLAAGTLVFFGVLLACNVFLPWLGIYQFNLVGPLASVAFTGSIAYTIARHHLLDIRIVIQRSLIYSLLLGLIVASYLFFLATLNVLISADENVTALAASIATIMLGIFGVPYIERTFRRATDMLFFKDTYEYAVALEALSEVLHRNVTFEDLVSESESELTRILRASSVRILLGNPGECDPAKNVLSVPIGLDGEAIGCINLGAKRSGDPYTPRDQRLLKTFAYQAATALSRAQLYARVKHHAEELEVKVDERTQELSRAQARERQILNDLSHNLQTPLTVLQTRLDQLPGTIRENKEVRALEQSLSSFSGFVYELMSLARLEGGRRLKRTPLNLSSLLEELSDEIRVIADAQGVSVETELAAELWIKGDATRIREAVMNIASNALKYLPGSGARAVCFALKMHGDAAEIAISDTGVGITPEDLPHIFDRFYRGKDTQPAMRGTGLGLAITKRIVEQHKGTISAASTPDHGTRIILSFPLVSR